MRVKLCEVNAAAVEKLPPQTDDKSGIGVHYIDAYIKPMNVKLEDGTPVRCKRRGLKITLSAGTKKGEGLRPSAMPEIQKCWKAELKAHQREPKVLAHQN